MANTYTALFYHIVFSTKNRASFISIYRENVLANLHAQFQAIANRRVPDPPERGSLDLSRVADSLYFCH